MNTRLTVPTPQGYFLLSQENIIFCESDGNYTTLYLTDRRITCSKKLKDIEARLSQENFLRTHQSYLVNLDYVTKYYRRDNGRLELIDGKIIPVSRSRKESVMRRIKVI